MTTAFGVLLIVAMIGLMILMPIIYRILAWFLVLFAVFAGFALLVVIVGSSLLFLLWSFFYATV